MTTLTREKPLKPELTDLRPAQKRPMPTIVTRAEIAPCKCPEHCERDHEHD